MRKINVQCDWPPWYFFLLSSLFKYYAHVLFVLQTFTHPMCKSLTFSQHTLSSDHFCIDVYLFVKFFLSSLHVHTHGRRKKVPCNGEHIHLVNTCDAIAIFTRYKVSHVHTLPKNLSHFHFFSSLSLSASHVTLHAMKLFCYFHFACFYASVRICLTWRTRRKDNETYITVHCWMFTLLYSTCLGAC